VVFILSAVLVLPNHYFPDLRSVFFDVNAGLRNGTWMMLLLLPIKIILTLRIRK
jgi:hypothetical protein